MPYRSPGEKPLPPETVDLNKLQETCPSPEIWNRFRRILGGEPDSRKYDCGRTALYIFGFMDAPEKPIPPWEDAVLPHLEPIKDPEPWCLVIYKEQIFNHTGIVVLAQSNGDRIVFSKHGTYGEPIFEREGDILEWYPTPEYYRVNLPTNAISSIA